MNFLKISLFTALTILISSDNQPAEDRPNVLFIAIDDLRPELGCYGKSHIHSPHIDKLAASGFIFNKNYCQVPVCGASRASLLSGIRPRSDRFVDYDTRLSEDFPDVSSLPAHFKGHGYTTLSRGKIFHHSDDQENAWSAKPWSPEITNSGYGWFDYQAESSLAVIRNHPDYSPDGDWRGIRGPAFEWPDVTDNAYRDGKLAEALIKDLEQLSKSDKPFFLAGGFWKPHLPFNAPRKYWDLYDRDQIPLSPVPGRPNGAPDAAIHNSGELRNYGLIPSQGPLSKDTAKILTHGYYACISYTDTQVGKVLDAVHRLELEKNTIIVLWGDHGWNLEDHSMWCKHANFETSMRAPLIFKIPGYSGGVKIDALTEFVDIYPTLCQLADLPIPAHLEGQGLSPLFRNPTAPFKTHIYSRFKKGESVKTSEFVYSEWRKSDHGPSYARMLYDHRTDSLENINVAEKAEYSEVVAELSKQLRIMRMR